MYTIHHTAVSRPATTWVLCVATAALVLTGCANLSETQSDAAKGAGIGALGGAILGAVTGGSKGATTGAVLGGAVGAAGAYIWSKKMDDQKAAMEEATAGTGIGVTQTADNQLKLEIPNEVSFDVGRATIKQDFAQVLGTFASSLNAHPSTTVTIIGHTDSSGSDAVNDPLSVQRANSTRDYLVARGVSPSRLLTQGRGSREPVASNATADGRAQNRRVEMFVAEPATTPAS